MARFGLVTRIALVVLAIVAALQLLLTGLYYLRRDGVTEAGFRPPLPDQAAAMILLLDDADAAQRQALLRALNGTGLQVRLSDAPPPLRPNEVERSSLQTLVRAYLADDGRDDSTRLLSVRFGAGVGRVLRHFPRVRDIVQNHIRVVAGLRGGGYVVIDVGGSLVSRVFGLPAGFFAGMIGFLVAGLALLAVAREMRPLSRLAQRVTSFGRDGAPQRMPERGAREVRVLIGAVNRMQERIAALLRSRSFMLGALSHDLRTYLTRMRLRLELIPDAAMRDRAGRDVEDMQALIEDALDFARDGFVGDASEPVDLVRLVRQEADRQEAAGGIVRTMLPPAPVMVSGSALAFGRTIANLIDNAVKYGGEAEVTLRVARDAAGGMAVLEIADRGPGIPEAERQRIFEPFERLEASRNRDQGGSGLGLAIAKQVAEGYGGSIAVGTAPGGGALLRLSLPLLAADT